MNFPLTKTDSVIFQNTDLYIEVDKVPHGYKVFRLLPRKNTIPPPQKNCERADRLTEQQMGEEEAFKKYKSMVPT